MEKTPYFDLMNNWFSFTLNNNKAKPIHSAMYSHIVNKFNLLFWKKEMGLPTDMTMEILNISSYNTYKKCLNDLIDFGYIIEISKSINQYHSRVIALSKINKALYKATDKALLKQTSKQVTELLSDKNTTNTLNLETIKQLNIELSKKEKIIEEQALLISELEKKLSKPKRKTKPEPLHAECKKYFLDYFLEKKNSEYYWEAKDAKALNSVIKKIRAMPTATDEKMVSLGFEKLIVSIKDFDNFIFENLEMSMINSKFNSLIEKIKSNKKQINGTNRQINKKGTTTDELKQILSKHFD